MRVIMIFKAILLFVAITCCWASPANETPRRFATCRGPNDCSNNECCVMPTQRYTYPTCQPLRSRGDICRPTANIGSSNLTFPDGSVFEYNNAHMFLCPCAEGLKCSRSTSGGYPTCSKTLNPANPQ